MNIKPATAPMSATSSQQFQTTNNSAARDKAMAAFMKGAETPAQTAHPAQLNQNNVSPEDLSAIQTQTRQTNEVVSPEIDTVEQVVSSETDKPKVDTKAQEQFEQLKRQERQLRLKVQQQAQAIKAKEDALAAREAQLTAKDQEYSQGYIKQDRIKQDILGVMAEQGISYDDVVQQILNQQPKNPQVEAKMSAMESKIQALTQMLEDNKKSQVEAQDASYKAAVNQIRLDVKNLVKNDSNFELIQAANATNDVVQLIEETYQKDGILLSVEQASEEVEKYLEEEAMKFTRLGKIKKKLETTSTSQAQQQPQQKQSQPMKTLTNAASSVRQLSARERAVLAFKGEKP